MLLALFRTELLKMKNINVTDSRIKPNNNHKLQKIIMPHTKKWYQKSTKGIIYNVAAGLC